jgi:nucleoside-diphosphate-sugar epimerase
VGKAILQIANVDAEIELHDSPKGSVRRRAPDIQKLRSLVNFQEEWTLADGLRKTMDFYLPDGAP